MDAALLEAGLIARSEPPLPELDHSRLRDIVLLRIAFSGRATPRDGLVRELAPLTAHAIPADRIKPLIERDIAALADAGLVDVKPSHVSATDAGAKRAAMILGGRGAPPKTWAEARDIRLIAKVLGLDGEPLAKLKRLAKPEGLRAAIVVKAFKLKIRGAPSPTRLRVALAQEALARAFGNRMKPADRGKSGLSPSAGRKLAGQLAKSPRDFRTDARLIAALAADHLHIAAGDAAALQLAILRKYLTKGEVVSVQPPARKSRKPVRSARARTELKSAQEPLTATAPAMPIATPPPPASTTSRQPQLKPVAASRPDLAGFVSAVRVSAQGVAEGWAGNRKAYISRVWRRLAEQRPDWSLSEIEFKCMLAETHRLGHLVLASADLKDGHNLKDVQDSAVAYRNATFHYVRVDD